MEEDSGGIFSETYKKLKTWINIILNLKVYQILIKMEPRV